MSARTSWRPALVALSLVLISTAALAQTTKPAEQFEPVIGQPGKDVVWVPTPQALVNKMLDMAQVTAQDYVVDLGSGDGGTVIAAAKRGARAHGIEYNPDMVELSRRNAASAGVSAKATFEKADIFETDFSSATVVTLFLLPELNLRLRPTILKMKPGTRIISNTFPMDDWQPDEKYTIPDCDRWCEALFWIVPAKVDGTWHSGQTTITLRQTFQMLSGTYGSTAITNGRVRGDEISFSVGPTRYTGRLNGNAIVGISTPGSTPFSATR